MVLTLTIIYKISKEFPVVRGIDQFLMTLILYYMIYYMIIACFTRKY
jgi:hypothetical protein